MIQKYYAHTVKAKPPSDWQPLEEHLRNVAEMTRLFADAFGAGDWGYLAGLWHDIGKYSDEFQQKLSIQEGSDAHIETKPGRVDHSTAGAKHASNLLKDKGKLLAYVIAGHHAGLLDGKSNDACLYNRLKKENIPDYSSCPERILSSKSLGNLPFDLNVHDPKRFGFQISFFIRMIYSCLVDADFLDTEVFMNKEKSSWRKGYPSLTELDNKLSSALNQLAKDAPKTSINKHRAAILKDCLDAAGSPQGLFSLTVPTGGGKTLSSLAFAMKHALKHGLERIIYVIPYTSIIEQNAAVFRDILGEDAVLEHHSNFEPKEEDHRSRLAPENWDAPLIVTTNVQFFESLFRSRSSRCRKIHNIANSVVILDEAQMLPVPLLKPCLEVLRELSTAYKTSIVLCTATQPALSTTETFKDGLEGVREIVSDPSKLYAEFKRVQVEKLPMISDDELAKRLNKCKQVLCIVNTRKHARLIFERIHNEKEGCYHLSALMCPAHRTATLNKIRSALLDDIPCRVVSTQLIEAGVDIDFPVVFRSLAGIDSIAQAAGRCNREGKLHEGGQVFVFSPEDGLPPGHFRQTAQTAEGVMRHHEDLLSQEAVTEYFRTLYWIQGERLDEYRILDDLAEDAINGNFPFRVVDKKFKIIEDGAESIIIPWNEEAEKIISGLRYSEYPASFARKAQRYAVQVYPKVLGSLVCAGSVECMHDQYCVLTNMDIYRDDLGLCPEDPTFHKVGNLIV
ncbi:MAG: CRISPR-associated helicase Cas3' [Proteobacteria bacterium]|nr:CRISPR-associated helicase Cas3' [Desulfobacteraceae bacterium]MBU4013813.1 CRISPR-associated helicase Cas3' [Pseudomonadota bacterium]MBU4067800.1 CRISPR-associated helicase Cas3' [Pseudomonadota bacterium]MBU4100479.1 CRISPR-associated helicase Cas3' [Pseudomonadota bacterium]MCG2758692.1 CRISPR-associated helicase Cas3' [Desulfobacteraceae bacterium]